MTDTSTEVTINMNYLHSLEHGPFILPAIGHVILKSTDFLQNLVDVVTTGLFDPPSKYAATVKMLEP